MQTEIKQNVPETALNTTEIAEMAIRINSSARYALRSLYLKHQKGGLVMKKRLDKLEQFIGFTEAVYKNDGRFDFCTFEQAIQGYMDEFRANDFNIRMCSVNISCIKDIIHTIQPHLSEKEVEVDIWDRDVLCGMCLHKENCNQQCEADCDCDCEYDEDED